MRVYYDCHGGHGWVDCRAEDVKITRRRLEARGAIITGVGERP